MWVRSDSELHELLLVLAFNANLKITLTSKEVDVLQKNLPAAYLVQTLPVPTVCAVTFA